MLACLLNSTVINLSVFRHLGSREIISLLFQGFIPFFKTICLISGSALF